MAAAAESLEHMLNKFFEHFQCAICISTLKCTYTTKNCAHRFCEECIKECINTLHRCPLCNRALRSEDEITKDAQFDDLISCVSKLKAKDEENFLIKLIASETDANNNDTNPNSKEVQFNPLENILKKHIMSILDTHKSYYNQLHWHYLNELKLIDEKTEKKLEVERDREKQREIKENSESAKKTLNEKFEETTKIVCKVYDKYLAENLPKPSVVQVKLNVRILRKNFKFDGLVMKPTDDVQLIFQFAENKVKEMSEDKIIEYENDVVLLCFGPFANYNSGEIQQIYEKYLNNNLDIDNYIKAIKIKNCMPVLEYAIKTGSQLVICGTVKFESDLPAQCYSKKFDKNNVKPVDYYSCKTCDLKWICKSCVLSCHVAEDHETAPFSMAHIPTWGCCYCKKKNCLIKNN